MTMTPVSVFSGQTVALFGLGGSGLATALALQAGGALVHAWDDAEASREKAAAAGVSITNLAQADWSSFAALVLSPGVPLTHPEPHWTVKKAQAAHVEIIGDIELFCRERNKTAPGAPFIAITGTNGKSTTTALIAHILTESGKNVQLGGNIGTAILALEPPRNDRIHVIECSTFQIDLAPSLNPGIGILLNLTPDHIDRHGTMDNYAAIKERLVAASVTSIVVQDDAFTGAILQRLRAAGRHVICVSAIGSAEYFYQDKALWQASANGAVPCADLSNAVTLRGVHNGQNAVAAFAACVAAGVAPALIARALLSFPGLAHRMEQVGQKGHVQFINDSKATNADAAEKALLTFDPIYWILGGKAKEGGIEPLKPLFSRVAKAYLIGASAQDFARTLEGLVPYELCGTLEIASERAAQDAAQSGKPATVLLSPACASYDQFANFEQRGDMFRALVKNLTAP